MLLCTCHQNQPPEWFLNSRNAAPQIWVSSSLLLTKSEPSPGLDWQGHSWQSREWDSYTLLGSPWACCNFAPSSKGTLENRRGCSGCLWWCLTSWKIQSKTVFSRESHSWQFPEAPLLFWCNMLALCSSPGQISSLQSWRERPCTEFSVHQCSELCSSEARFYLQVCLSHTI